MKKKYYKRIFKYRTYTNGIGALGKRKLSTILAFRDRIPAYVSPKKYDHKF